MSALRLLSAFAWVLVPLGIWLAASMWGTPHVMLGYRYVANGDGYVPSAYRQRTACTYWGMGGSVTIRPYGARCPWVRLLKVDRQRGG